MSNPTEEALPPSLPWRFGSAFVMGLAGTLTRTFMQVPNSQDAHGLDGFLKDIDDRQNIEASKRGLITCTSNSLSDPVKNRL